MAKGFKLEGMKELEKAIKKLGEVPAKAVTPSAKKGMNIALKGAKANAPVDKGELKTGIKLYGEKYKKGKKVYRIIFDPKKNEVFQKKNENDEITGYYPVSQEYGFFARNGRYVEGKRFIHNAFAENYSKIKKTIVDEMSKRIDKALKG